MEFVYCGQYFFSSCKHCSISHKLGETSIKQASNCLFDRAAFKLGVSSSPSNLVIFGTKEMPSRWDQNERQQLFYIAHLTSGNGHECSALKRIRCKENNQRILKKGEGKAGKKCEQEPQSTWVCKAVDFLLLLLRPKRRCLSKTLPTSHVMYA